MSCPYCGYCPSCGRAHDSGLNRPYYAPYLGPTKDIYWNEDAVKRLQDMLDKAKNEPDPK